MITITAEAKWEESPSAIEEEADDDIRAFDEWFQGLGNDPLVRGEVAIIKTYLAWKLRVKAPVRALPDEEYGR